MKKGLPCGHCDKLLKGLFYQGYTCTICSVLLHRECISFVHKCGMEPVHLENGHKKVPPALPPRPASMLIHSSETCATDQVLSRFSSTVSLTSTLQERAMNLPLPPPPPASQTTNKRPRKFKPPPLNLDNCGNPDYINTKMEDHSWFVGEMDRPCANRRLAHFPVCTFLVRCRLQRGEKVGLPCLSKQKGM